MMFSSRILSWSRFGCVGLGCFLALPAMAQWQWIDDRGQRVFSDQPPPPSVADKQILRRPAATGAATPAPEAAPAAAQTNKPNPARDPQLEARRKELEAAEAQKRQAEAERQARQRAENCDRARKAKATLDSGIRVASINAQGEREFLDDKARAAEVKRVEEIIRRECGPVPSTDSPAQ